MEQMNFNPIEEVEMENKIVEEVDEIEEAPEAVIGKVVMCKKLNVRKAPNANSSVVCVVDANTELMIDMTESTNEWYSVYTSAGLSGFCMRKFVAVVQ